MFHLPNRAVDANHRRSSTVGLLAVFTAVGGLLLVATQHTLPPHNLPEPRTVLHSAERPALFDDFTVAPLPQLGAPEDDQLSRGGRELAQRLAGPANLPTTLTALPGDNSALADWPRPEPTRDMADEKAAVSPVDPVIAPPPAAIATPAARIVLPVPMDTRIFIALEPPLAGSHGVMPLPTTVAVERGDTLLAILQREGVERLEAHAAVDALADVYDPRRLRPGLRLTVETDRAAEKLVRLAFEADRRSTFEVVRERDGYLGRAVEKPVSSEERFIAASVERSLYEAAVGAGMPAEVLMRSLKVFSWDVDFQRDVRPGDGIGVLFDAEVLDDETVVGGSTIRYAKLTVGGRTVEAFRHKNAEGAVEYFDRKGRSLRKFLLRTPVDSARISSGFGMRRHPILGYSKMHKGVDFAAPTGTKIYAAGAGKIEKIGRHGGYGNYIRIRHGNGYATAYAHLSKFARGLKRGQTIRQGQVIGYVGSTGRSTGPHLHFEVMKGNKQVNPLKVAQPPASELAGKRLGAFEALVAEIDQAVQRQTERTVVAAKTGVDRAQRQN